ncbi:MAG: peptide/nickel transport system substrate-binding protein [Gammaproteobacteria bacterium]|jgi:peptide/nickel transport system substrate-binding protein
MKDKENTDLVDRMSKDARRGQLGRREFLQYSVAAGMTAATAGGLWISDVQAATPKKGGKFRLGTHDGNTSDTHDPGTYLSFSTIQLAHTHRSYLTQINADNSLGADMAESWSASDDASQWTFKLNKNASFHNGNAFTAADAIASLNHHRGEKTTSAAKALMADVTDIVKVDDHTITVKLKGGNADFPWLVTDYHIAICPANADGTLNWQTGVGAGPYKITNHKPGVGTDLVRHDGWHGEGAYFDAIKITVLNDPNARQTALVTGDVDAVTQLDLKTLSLLKRDKNVEVDNVPSGAAITLPMFCDQAPFDDVNVRNALKLSMDRDEIIEKIAFGTAIPGNDVHVSPNMPYWADLPQRAYDPDKAKSLLKKAGKEGLTVSLSTADSVYSGAVDMCVLYAEQAKAAGITINVVREPNDGYYSDVWLKKPFCMVQWGARPTPDVMLSLTYKDDAAWNESHWQNKRFNELLLQAKAELDEAKRTKLYHEMQVLAHDDGGTIIPMFTNFVYARRKNVRHSGQLAGSWQIDGARGTSRWWFA